MLTSLIPKPRDSYAIRRDIRERNEGPMKPSLTTRYNVLHRLLSDGLIEKEKDEIIDRRVRHTYRITGLGQQAVAEQECILQLLNAQPAA